MRGSGKTTRTIDAAIQTLFNEGQIILPKGRDLVDVYELTHGFVCDIIVDDDWGEGKAQQHMIQALIRRLHSEHQGQFKITDKGNFILIQKS